MTGLGVKGDKLKIGFYKDDDMFWSRIKSTCYKQELKIGEDKLIKFIEKLTCYGNLLWSKIKNEVLDIAVLKGFKEK